MHDNSQRLHQTIAAVCPIDGISIDKPGDSSTCKFFPAPSATSTQVTAGQNALTAFDWTDAAYQNWLLQQLRVTANANVGTAAPGLSEPVYVALRAIVELVVDQLNTIRAALPSPLAALTYAQAKTAIQNKINAGTVDT